MTTLLSALNTPSGLIVTLILTAVFTLVVDYLIYERKKVDDD